MPNPRVCFIDNAVEENCLGLEACMEATEAAYRERAQRRGEV